MPKRKWLKCSDLLEAECAIFSILRLFVMDSFSNHTPNLILKFRSDVHQKLNLKWKPLTAYFYYRFQFRHMESLGYHWMHHCNKFQQRRTMHAWLLQYRYNKFIGDLSMPRFRGFYWHHMWVCWKSSVAVLHLTAHAYMYRCWRMAIWWLVTCAGLTTWDCTTASHKMTSASIVLTLSSTRYTKLCQTVTAL